MAPLTVPSMPVRPLRAASPWRGLSLLGGALAWAAAAAVGALLVLVAAAAAVVLVAMVSVLLTLAGAAARMRRVRRPGPGAFLEARRVGGHAWVAYGWDGEL